MVITGYLSAKTFKSIKDSYSIKTIFRKWARLIVPYLFVYILQVTIMIIKDSHRTIIWFLGWFVQGGEGLGSYYFPVMMQIVIIVPLVIVIIKKWNVKGLIICFIFNLAFEAYQTQIHLDEELYRLVCFRYIFIVSYGVWLFFSEGKDSKMSRIFKVIVGLVGLLFLICFNYMSFSSVISHEWKNTTLLGVLYIVPIMGFLIRKKQIHFMPIETLGRASYNIFLVQMIYYWCVVGRIYERINNIVLEIIISVLICCGLGLIFYYIEQPVTRRINKLISNI